MRMLPLIFAALVLRIVFASGPASAELTAHTERPIPFAPDRRSDSCVGTPGESAHVVPRTTRARLPELAREAVAIHFHASKYESLQELIDATPVCDEYKNPSGLFVTLSKNGQTRACWGSIYSQDRDLVKATVLTTEAALTKEYRFPTVTAREWRRLKPQVTVVREIRPISSMSGQNPLRYGLLVRSGAKGAVLLPGEAADPHYQLMKCKLKASIPINQPCQLYRIRADVYK